MDIEKSTPERKFVFRHTEADPESKTERNGIKREGRKRKPHLS